MRTTVTLDPNPEALLPLRMRERGLSFEVGLNEAVRAGLAPGKAPGRFRTPTADLGLSTVITTLRAWVGDGPGLIVRPTPLHLSVIAGLLKSTGTGGHLTNDAHLAALALEHDALVMTFDRDFQRFSGVRWAPPRFS